MTKTQKKRLLKGVAALRSGEYRQTTGVLKSEVGHCCLGVLCEVYHKSTRKGEWAEEVCGGVWRFSLEDNDLHETILPVAVAKYYGIDTDPYLLLKKGDLGNSATYLNDTARKTFKQIAKGFENLANELCPE